MHIPDTPAAARWIIAGKYSVFAGDPTGNGARNTSITTLVEVDPLSRSHRKPCP
jgi:hypothetical protein